MALTDIARQLKETFTGYEINAYEDDVNKFKQIYGDAEAIRIDGLDYIVINQEYDSQKLYQEEYKVPPTVSVYFYNSIQQPYAIIDEKTSSTLIDEVYSRVTYMQRTIQLSSKPDKEEIRKNLKTLVGGGTDIAGVEIPEDGGTTDNSANIFQCRLIKDTGVSAVPDEYSFMLKGDQVSDISESVMRQINSGDSRDGSVTLLKDRDVLEESSTKIRENVFKKYRDADIDISSIKVKSIFEIKMSFVNIRLHLQDKVGRKGIFESSYLASKNNELAPLNKSIHTCNCCGKSLVDVADPAKISYLHINTDAFNPQASNPQKGEYALAVGCDDCLVECDACGGWHYKYSTFSTSRRLNKADNLMPERRFVSGLRIGIGEEEINYCSCRREIEWTYDEKSGSEESRDVIPLRKMVFLSHVDEVIATYDEYEKFFKEDGDYKKYFKEEKSGRGKDVQNAALKQSTAAQGILARFKKRLAASFNLDAKDITVTTADKCRVCTVCGGKFFRNTAESDSTYRCEVCEKIVTERKHMVTRADGIVFIHRKWHNRDIINKYVMTRTGGLKLISSNEEAVKAEGNGRPSGNR